MEAAPAHKHRIGHHTSFDNMIAAHALMDGKGAWGTVVVDVAGGA